MFWPTLEVTLKDILAFKSETFLVDKTANDPIYRNPKFLKSCQFRASSKAGRNFYEVWRGRGWVKGKMFLVKIVLLPGRAKRVK